MREPDWKRGVTSRKRQKIESRLTALYEELESTKNIVLQRVIRGQIAKLTREREEL